MQAKQPCGFKIDKSYEIDDDTDIYITLIFQYDDMFTFELSTSELTKIKSNFWLNLLNDGSGFDLADSYGSHCDNGEVSLSNKNGFVIFTADTATGGKSTFKVPIDKCKDAFLELADWYNTLPSVKENN